LFYQFQNSFDHPTICGQITSSKCSPGPLWSDQIDIASLGQLSVAGFSSIGTDVYNFPQQRSNNTFQWADTITKSRRSHRYTFGLEVRRVALNSLVKANYRPAADYHGLHDYGPQCKTATPCPGILPVTLSSTSTVSLAEAAAFQTFAVAGPNQSPDYDLRLRATQLEFFAQDQFNIGDRFNLVAGARFQNARLPQDTGYFAGAFNQQTRQSLIDTANNNCATQKNAAVCSLSDFMNQLLPTSLQSALDPRPFGLDARLGFAWDADRYRKTTLRGGIGRFTGQFPAIIAEEARNVFPAFLTFSGGINTAFGKSIRNACEAQGVISCNAINALSNISTTVTSNTILANVTYPGGPKHPSSIQQNLTLEHRFGDTVLTVAYVGTEGRHLLNVLTPNGGLSRSFENTIAGTYFDYYGNIVYTLLPYPGGSNGFVEKPIQYQGADTPWIVGTKVLSSGASSSYNALQISLTTRPAKWLQTTSAFTWSHAIDNASDFANLAGAFALPQNSIRPTERGSSNFDVRYRSVTHFVAESPHNASPILRDWLLSGILTFQSAQPYTINTSIDVNEDGNATDRLNNTSCLVPGSDSRTQWQTVDPSSCLASPGQDGVVGRNTFRGWGLYNIDLALGRSFMLNERHSIQIRSEVYNLLNHPNFGIPNRILESPAFGRAVSSETSPRTIQFALKYSF
jgi:hypothetical protein